MSSSFCENCGKSLEPGAACSCQPAAAPPPPPPAYGPTPGYGPPPGYGSPPPVYGPPQGVYYPPPQPGQMQQSFGAVKGTIGNFIKDPYGTAQRGGSLPTGSTVILLAAQVLSFVALVALAFNKVFSQFFSIMNDMGMRVDTRTIREIRQVITDVVGFEFWMRIALVAAIGITALYVCMLLASKICKVTVNPKTLLSAQALSSIMMSASFLALALIITLLGFDEGVDFAGTMTSMMRGGSLVLTGNVLTAIHFMIIALGAVSSLLLLEVSMRGVMPEGVGNVQRLIMLTVSFGIAIMITLIVTHNIMGDYMVETVIEVTEELAEIGMSSISRGLGGMFW